VKVFQVVYGHAGEVGCDEPHVAETRPLPTSPRQSIHDARHVWRPIEGMVCPSNHGLCRIYTGKVFARNRSASSSWVSPQSASKKLATNQSARPACWAAAQDGPCGIGTVALNAHQGGHSTGRHRRNGAECQERPGAGRRRTHWGLRNWRLVAWMPRNEGEFRDWQAGIVRPAERPAGVWREIASARIRSDIAGLPRNRLALRNGRDTTNPRRAGHGKQSSGGKHTVMYSEISALPILL